MLIYSMDMNDINDAQSTTARRRLIRDFRRLSTDPPGGISGSPCPENIMLWNAVIFGPGASCVSPKSTFLKYAKLTKPLFY